MTNTIHEVRQDLERRLSSARRISSDPARESSPCGQYRLEIEDYEGADGIALAVATVRRTVSGELIGTIKRNDDRCFYAWVSRDGRDYLLFPEDLEGQTVIDLTSGQIEGFTSPEDPFIWAGFHPSPDRSKLAVIGCYWACPYMVTVYDFQEPLNLPSPKLAEFILPENNAQFYEWATESMFRIRSENGIIHEFQVPGNSIES